jgi:predicted phosphodiesterase
MRREGRLFFCLAMALTLASCTSTADLDEPTQEVLMETPEASMVPAASPTMQPATTVPPSPTPSIFDAELPVGDVSYKIPLTIRHVTEESATLFFELETPATGFVSIRSEEPGVQPIEISLEPSQTRHLVTAHNLNPGLSYDALVAVGTDEGGYRQPDFLSRAWGPVSFQTRSENDSLRIGVIGDASFGDETTTALIKEMAAADLDFVLHTGDVVDETEEGVDPFDSYAEKFYTPFEPLLTTMPVYTVPGNHDYDWDIRLDDEPFYFHAFPPFLDPLFPGQDEGVKNQNYAVALGDIQFVMLDSQTFYGQPGRAEQETWLDERLADPRFGYTIPIMHVAPYNSSAVHPTDSIPVRSTWVPKFEGANVPLVLSGHFQAYERLAKNGIRYVITGGGSSIVYAQGALAPESELFRRVSHYLLMELNAEAIALSAVARGGEVIDAITIPLE